MEGWITRGVDVICVAVENREGLSPVLRKARSKGIKVVTWDADAEPDARDFFVNQATPEGIGHGLMDNAARVMGGKGEFAIITGSLTASNLNEWQKHIEARLNEKYPDIKLVVTRPCDDQQKKAFDETKTVLTAHPNVKLIMAICSPAVPGAAEAVKQSGRNDVKVIGLGLPNDNKPFVHAGITDTRDPLEHDGPGLPHGPRREAGRRRETEAGRDRDDRRPARAEGHRQGETSCSASRSPSPRRTSTSSTSESRNPMSGRVYLGVDLGAESGRVVAGIFDGRRVRLEELHRFPNGPLELAGSWRWDVSRLWSEIQRGLSAAARFGDSVVSVGVDTWGVDYVLLSKSGELVDQPFHYRDRRTDGVMERVSLSVPRADIFSATGLQFLSFNTLYQLLSSPELLTHADRLLLMPDYFHYRLCGSTAAEFTNATTTQFFNPIARTWAFELLRRFGLPAHMLGAVVQPGTRLGTLRPDVQIETGLGAIPVVAPATHDTASAVVAVPTANTGKANWAYISSGTWSLVGVELPEANLSPTTLARNLTNEGGVDGTYRLLKNVMGLWIVQRCRAAFQQRGLDCDYDTLMAKAEVAEPLRSLIDPDDPRFLNPPDMPLEIAAYCRETAQPVPDTVGRFIRCCLDSLAWKYRHIVGWLEEVTGEPIEVIHVVGGGARNRLLNQLTANATGRPVLAGPVEATVLGNVLIQARAAGVLGSLGDVRAVVRESFPVERFDPRSDVCQAAVD